MYPPSSRLSIYKPSAPQIERPTHGPAPRANIHPRPEALLIAQAILKVPAGASVQHTILGLPGWEGTDSIRWSVSGLPDDVTARFLTAWGHPASGQLQLDTPGSLPPGLYPFQVSAVAGRPGAERPLIPSAPIGAPTPVPGHDGVPASAGLAGRKTWSAPAALEVFACQESVALGSFTQTLAASRIDYCAGGPTHPENATGIRSADLIFGQSTLKRKLRVSLDAAILETGQASAEPPSVILYRSSIWPVEMATLGGYEPNVVPLAESVNGALEWLIAPGAYLLFFRSRFWQSAAPALVAVTYRVDIGPG